MKRRALVFDLDGTLVDSAPDLHAVLCRILPAGRPQPTLEAVKAMVGDGARTLVKRALLATGGIPPTDSLDAAFERFRADYQRRPVEFTRPYPGVVAGLSALAEAGWSLAVCTNKPETPARAILAHFGLLPRFGAVIGGDSTATRKPDAGPLLAAIAPLGVDARDTVLVGDGPHDAGAAHAAATGFIGVSWGYQPEALRAEYASTIFVDRFDAIAKTAEDVLSRRAR